MKILAFILVCLNCLDWHSTWLLLRRRLGTEQNPILAMFLTAFGDAVGLLLYKAPLGVGIILIYPYAQPTPELFGCLVALCALYFVAVVNNYRIASGRAGFITKD